MDAIKKARGYNFAREGHKRLIPQDNLSLDAMDALAAGMSYGKYKAMHPNTKDANEARLAEMNAPKTEPTRRYKPRTTYLHTCAHCGRDFTATRKDTIYCSLQCKGNSNNKKWRQNRYK